MKRRAFVPVLFLALFGLAAAAMAQGSPPTPPSPPEAEALTTEMEKVLRQAEKAQSASEEQASRILGLMEDFLAFLAVVLAVAGALSFVGFLESRKVRNEVKEELSEVRAEAKAVVREAQKARQRAEQTEKRLATAVDLAEQGAQRIRNWRDSLDIAWIDIDAAFEKLPSLDVAAETEGMESEVPDLPIEVLSTFEDADVILVLGDRLKVTEEREKMGTHFLKLARFWVIKKDYPRALARAERAVRLTSRNTRERIDAHRYVAWSLANWADLLPPGSPRREKTIQQALTALEAVKAELDKVEKPHEGDDSRYLYLFVLAWTLETRGDFGPAAAAYKEAREEARKVIAVRKDLREDWRITYNRACSLAQIQQLEEALDEVKLFLETWPERWRQVTEDPDLETLRQGSWKKRFDSLVEDAESRTGRRS